jgi:hypothetical protein
MSILTPKEYDGLDQVSNRYVRYISQETKMEFMLVEANKKIDTLLKLLSKSDRIEPSGYTEVRLDFVDLPIHMKSQIMKSGNTIGAKLNTDFHNTFPDGLVCTIK